MKKIKCSTLCLCSLFICYFLSGCAAGLVLEGLEAAEIATITRTAGMAGRYGLAVRGSSLVVAEEATFFSRLRRVKLEPAMETRPSRLYISENGTKGYFGIVEDATRIKLIDYVDRTIELPSNSSLYRVNKNANLRTGPGSHYAIYKLQGKSVEPLTQNSVVLVLRQVGQWYEVQIGRNEIGYISAALLTPAVLAHGNGSAGSLACDFCSGRGYVYKKIDCYSCHGNGRIKCSYCHGDRQFVCSNCHGDRQFVCPDCHGDRQFRCAQCHGERNFVCSNCKGNKNFICSGCNGKGYILTLLGKQPCNTCYQSGYIPCNTCYQSGFIPCNTCYQSGFIPCNTCYQSGYIPCNTCYQSGYIPCNYCYQSGYSVCNICNGQTTSNEKYQCSKCDGAGFVKSTSFSTVNLKAQSSYSLNFKEEFNDNKNLWSVNSNYVIKNGKYVISNPTQQVYLSTTRLPIDLTMDYTVSCDTRHISGIMTRGYGIVFSSYGSDKHYRFMLAGNEYALFKINNGVVESLIPWTQSEEIRSGNQLNNLSIKKSGSSCLLFINDTYVNKIYQFEDMGKWVGLVVESNQTIEFDNLKVNQ